MKLTSGDASDERFLRKALKGAGAIISPTVCLNKPFRIRIDRLVHLSKTLNISSFPWQEGFLSNVKSLRGVKHAILLSQVRIHLHDLNFVIFISIL